jgi:hypothetical protein
MRYMRDGNLHRVVRITGPAHNLLGIEFVDVDPADCTVERLGPAVRQPGQLNDDEVKAWVLGAVANANAEFGTHLFVRRIQYVADDTRDADAYAAMTRELVSRAG